MSEEENYSDSGDHTEHHIDFRREKDFEKLLQHLKTSHTSSFNERPFDGGRICKFDGKLDTDVSPNIRERLKLAWSKLKKSDSDDSKDTIFTDLQRILLSPLFSHYDSYFIGTSWMEQSQYREAYCLHILNEVITNRSRIIKNTERLSQASDTELRDQGFTRPKILIIVPFRNAALDIVLFLGKLWEAFGGEIDNKKRLLEEFGPSEEDLESDAKKKETNQPRDFIHTFRENVDDCFRLGIKFTRKSMKLFCDFYSSDVIIASPLGLRFVIDGQSETKKIKGALGKRSKTKRIVKKGDYDFLSSIQTLIIDQADVILMQNWEHLLHAISHLNKIPKSSHECDFSRVQSIFLDGLASRVRQNIVFSEFAFPELNSLIKGFENCIGKFFLQSSNQDGILRGIKHRPELHIIDPPSLLKLPEYRLEYFLQNIFPKYKQTSKHVCIFVPSYLDFVQLREHFSSNEISHSLLSEYSSSKEISTSRTRFYNGQARFLLVSERFHFFKRYRIRGIKTLIFYSLPEHSEYFKEWCDFLGVNEPVSIIVSPFDYLKAERVFGSKKTVSLFNN